MVKKDYLERKAALSRSKGFTMIEFLLVLIVAAILIALAFKIYQSTRINAEGQSISSKITQFAGGLENYRQNNNFYPAASCSGSTWTNNTATSFSAGASSIGASCYNVLSYVGNFAYTEGWTYSCAPGAASGVMSFRTGAYPLASAQNALVALIKDKNISSNYTCSVNTILNTQNAYITCLYQNPSYSCQ